MFHRETPTQQEVERLASCVPIPAHRRRLASAHEVTGIFRPVALVTLQSGSDRAACKRMRAKLGLTQAHAGDTELIDGILLLLARNGVDYTIFWRRLSHAVGQGDFEPVRDLFADRPGFDAWLLSYSELLGMNMKGLAADLMLKSNPKFILRNHLGEQVIRAAKLGDFSELQILQRLLERPFDEHPGHDAYAAFPPDWASSIEISCSS